MQAEGSIARRSWARPEVLVTHGVLIGLGFLYLYPFLWVLASSFKSQAEFFRSGPSLIPQSFLWENYVYAWTTGNFGTYLWNTMVVTVAVTALVVLCSSMAGYVLSRTDFPGKRWVLGGMLVLMFLPGGYTIIPLFELTQRLGLLNSLLGVILVQAAGGLIFNALLFMGYFATIGKEIEEAARVDGAGLPTTYWRIMLPLARPMIATVGLFQFMITWNAFWIPLVFTLGRPELRTLAVGLYAFVGENSTGWTYICAGA